jgi:hypothetical protein
MFATLGSALRMNIWHGLTIFLRILDKLHGAAEVVCEGDLHAGVLRPEPLDLLPQQLVVLLGEVVVPDEAAIAVVVGAVVALERAQVLRHAADGEVPRDEHRLGAKVDNVLHGGADAADHVRHVLEGRVPGLAAGEQPVVVVVAADLAHDDQRLGQEALRRGLQQRISNKNMSGHVSSWITHLGNVWYVERARTSLGS